MKPEVSLPQFGPEQLPTPPGQSVERQPISQSPETGVETGAERREQAAESRAAVADAAAITQPIQQVPTVVVPPNDDSFTTDDAPISAGDEDLIEKEWVDRAKKIISETKDDPFKREKAVAQLQADYLRKRYGREPGAANSLAS